LHSMLQLREDRCNLILELQTPLLEPCENLVGGRLFPRLDAIDISVDFVVALRESPELIIGFYHPLDKRDLFRKLISLFVWNIHGCAFLEFPRVRSSVRKAPNLDGGKEAAREGAA